MKVQSNTNVQIYIMINIDTSIKIKASKLFLNTWNNEEVAESWVQKSYTVNLSCSTSRALLRNSSLIFYPQEEFNQIFRHFATSFATDENSKNTSDTCQLFSYYQNFVEHEEYSSIGFPELEQTCEGYLHLELVTNNNTGHQLDKIQIDQQQLYILSATYLSPFAQNLVQDNKINGIQLDTTWSILKNYVTSIPTLICQNVGIPIGFQIGLHEDTSIYTN